MFKSLARGRRMWRWFLIPVLTALLLVGPGQAQELTALARLDARQSFIAGAGDDIEIGLSLSQPVPWRVRLLADPPRVLLDFREVDFTGLTSVPVGAKRVVDLRAGMFRPGWSRLVIELDGPHLVALADMKTADGTALVSVRLTATDDATFARLAAMADPPGWAMPKPVLPVAKPDAPDGPLIVVLDPGHGGLDPGAERAGQNEANLMLGFARGLKDLLLRTGRFAVVMTRQEDVFVPLEARISIARAAGADVFLSLHADALAAGDAAGAAIYTLSQKASETAAAALAERHDRDDLLAGLDLTGQDDVVATVLMDMARTETLPRTARLALAMEEAIRAADLPMHPVAQQSAGFSVLKSPDIPSVLIELGFLSSAGDLARLSDAKWRARMAEAIRDALLIWAQEDAALQAIRNQ